MAKQKSQECFILIQQNGSPVKLSGQYLVFKAKWRAIIAAHKRDWLVKKLTIEL